MWNRLIRFCKIILLMHIRQKVSTILDDYYDGKMILYGLHSTNIWKSFETLKIIDVDSRK